METSEIPKKTQSRWLSSLQHIVNPVEQVEELKFPLKTEMPIIQTF